MRYSILNVAYPFSALSSSVAGGAEQVLLALDSAIVNNGHRSFVLASKGSQVRGKLVEGISHYGIIDRKKCGEEYRKYREILEKTIVSENIDLVHFHGLDFIEYLPSTGIPMLVTLHLPLDWYKKGSFEGREGLHFNCVSQSQQKNAFFSRGLLEPVENGIPVQDFPPRRRRGKFAVVLGRICPEKGYHIAIDAARRANVPLLIAGTVFPYAEHRDYFRAEIEPRLDGFRYRYIGSVGPEEKKRLLGVAGCLLVPSLVNETSSLVAMEALSLGAPVIAFRNGALTDIVQDGVNGFLVDDVVGMAEAIRRVDQIDPVKCYEIAKKKYNVKRMISRYFDIYKMLIGSGRNSLYGHSVDDNNQFRDCA